MGGMDTMTEAKVVMYNVVCGETSAFSADRKEPATLAHARVLYRKHWRGPSCS